MSAKGHLTVQDKLLLAAHHLERDGRVPFTAEDLVVAAWRRYPDTFGLAGYKSPDGRLMYPDSNRVFAEIMGSKPVRKRGLLTKVGQKMYRLTEVGSYHATQLIGPADNDTALKSGLARDICSHVQRLMESRAARKHRSGNANDITFFDVCAFYGISPRSSAVELHGQVANVLGVLNAVKATVGKDTVTLQHGGLRYDASQVESLFGVHEFLQRKFKSEFDIIGMRIDERKHL